MATRSSVPSTSGTLLQRLNVADSEEAWRTFVDLYSPLIYRFCRRKGLQDADARDVLQDVFAELPRRMQRFVYDPDRGLFRNWLLTIVSHQIGRQQRLENRPDRADGDGQGECRMRAVESSVEAEWVEQLQVRVAEFALERIRSEFSEDRWRAFEAVWRQDRQPCEVAREMGKPVAWVYKSRYRILSRWKTEIHLLTEDHPLLGNS